MSVPLQLSSRLGSTLTRVGVDRGGCAATGASRAAAAAAVTGGDRKSEGADDGEPGRLWQSRRERAPGPPQSLPPPTAASAVDNSWREPAGRRRFRRGDRDRDCDNERLRRPPCKQSSAQTLSLSSLPATAAPDVRRRRTGGGGDLAVDVDTATQRGAAEAPTSVPAVDSRAAPLRSGGEVDRPVRGPTSRDRELTSPLTGTVGNSGCSLGTARSGDDGEDGRATAAPASATVRGCVMARRQ